MAISFNVVLLSFLSLIAVPQQSKEHDDTTICRIIAEGYQKYYESFPIVNCRYRVIKGDAESIEQALLGRYRHRITAPAVWYVDGSHVRLGVTPNLVEFSELWKKPEYTMKNALDQIVQRTPMETLNVLDNGSALVQEEPAFGIATVYDASSRKPAVWFTPLDMGIMGWGAHTNPAKDILTNTQDGKTCKLVKDMKDKLIRIEVGESQLKVRYTFDPEKQYALVQVESRFDSSGNAQEVTKVIELKDVGDGRVFPLKSITATFRGEKEIRYDVQEIVVDHLDLITKPPEKEFQITLPKGTRVTDGISGITIKLAKNEIVVFSSMNGLMQRVQREVKRNEKIVEQLANTRIDLKEPSGTIRWLSVLGVMLSLFLLLFSGRYLRNRLSKA